MTARKSSRTCRDCGKTGDLKEFCTGRNLCLKCQAERQRRSRNKKRETLDFGGNVSSEASVAGGNATTDNDNSTPAKSIFDNRESLTVGLRVEFEKALAQATSLVEFSNERLEAAKKTGDPDSIEEASKALQRASTAHVALITRLSEKLQGLDELAAKAEKARPVTMYLLQPGKFPDFEAMRQVPAEYWPDESEKSNEVEFD